MIKLFAIDLDGTMYTTTQTITSRVRETILQGIQAGINPVVVTGRGRRGAENALDALGMDLPYICSAGALVRSGRDGETIHAWTFHAHEELLHVIDFTRQHGTSLFAERDKGEPLWFGSDSMNEIMDPNTLREVQDSIRTFDPEKDFDQPMLKITLTASPGLLAKAKILVQEKCPSIHQVYAGVQYIDLTSENVNKGSALSALAHRLGLRQDEVAAIGDQDIDVHMLKFAGLPIAMSNAVPSVHMVARWVAPSNDQDGVAWAIERIVKYNQQDIL